MSNLSCIFNHNLSVEICILELVKIALKKNSSSIAIRFNPKKHKIQVVDNGIGFNKNELLCFCNYKQKKQNNQSIIFNQIMLVSNLVIITSRCNFSSQTYVLIASVSKTKIFKGYHRPSRGTTITVYGFDTIKWSGQPVQNCSISYVIAAIAFIALKVSFLLQNDDEQKIILNINKFHNPWDVLEYLKNNVTYQISSYSITETFHKDKLNLNLKEIEHNNEMVNNNLYNICSDFFFYNKIGVNNNNIYSPLSEWKNWSDDYKFIIIKSNNNKKNEIFSRRNQIHISHQNFISLSQMSIWSNWSYPMKSKIDYNMENNKRNPHYKFLPISIYKILPYKHCKILGNKKYFELSQCSSLNIINKNESNIVIRKIKKNFQNVTNIRVCNVKDKFHEYRISRNTINSLRILKQINKEFIASITNEHGKKILIMIDQHAIHERIRYEYLIETYTEKNSYNYLSVKLNKELWISDINKNLLELIVLHKNMLTRFGINVKTITDSICVVDAVPKCFIKKIKSYNHEYNLYRLIKNVKLLLLEIANGLLISRNIVPPTLPISIHNVIASEACHEAIKFGDPLNIKQCKLLIKTLKDTKAPTRCAHGRPSIIPLIDLSDLEQRKVFPMVYFYYFYKLYLKNKNMH